MYVCIIVTFIAVQVMLSDCRRSSWHHSIMTSNQMWSSWSYLLEWWGQGRIDPPKAGRGHATPVQPVQRAKCWRLLNLEPRFEWCHVRARHNALIYRPYKENANVFLVTASISPSVQAVWELHALSPGSIRPWWGPGGHLWLPLYP